MRSEYKNATYLHLLSHRSGLPANIPLVAFAQFKRDNDDPRTERVAFSRMALEMAPAAAIERTLVYSNNGYVVAGAMMEKSTGASWETLVREHIFVPLALSSAGFGAPGVAGRIDEPVGHAKGLIGDKRVAHELGRGVTDNPAALGPAGRVHMAAADILRYLDAHRERSALFLAAASWERLHTPPYGGSYALGWGLRPGPSLWHNGSNTLWYAEVVIDRSRGVSAFAAANDGFTKRSEPAVGKALAAAVEAGALSRS
jgi:CubicO group peptidase (beta-lactamase class C family)